ncbi:MAG: VanZ family protein, partial [Betaproteobacteria bacterium]|nr:VanZ family protein [Betaproteobacteria bacterium]
MTSITPHRSGLPAYLALAYLLLIAYASLSPFGGWREPSQGALHFLTAPWPRYYTRFDVIINFLAYLPLGFFVGLFLLARRREAATVALTAAAGLLLSFAMELSQAYLPGRISSNVDLLSNSAGVVAGALVAARTGRRPLIAVHLAGLRRVWFVPGHRADLGLALLGVWFFSQLDPSLPLAGTFEWNAPGDDPITRAGRHSLLQALSVTLNLAAAGLLLRLIARSAWSAVLAMGVLVAAATLIKLGAGWLLLKPEAALAWLSSEALVGVGYGAFLLVFTLPASARAVTLLCVLTLLAGIGVT